MSAQQPTTGAADVRSLSCLVKLEFISPDYDVQAERRVGGHWIPPTNPTAYRRGGATPWLRWSPQKLSLNVGEVDENENDYDVCSIFYNNEDHHYLAVPFDCRKRNIENRVAQKGWGAGWRRLRFEHSNFGDRNLSVLQFDQEHHVLAAPGSQTWLGSLVPQSYDYNDTVAQTPALPGDTLLAGKLSLMFAFAAFSCAKENFSVGLAAFQPPYWRPHGLEDGRDHGRGMIVHVRVDPNSNIGAKALHSFEEGERGPLVAN